MKKLVCFLMTLVMLLCLMGCSESETAETQATTEAAVEGLQVGFGRESITPQGMTVHLQGGDWANRRSTGMLDMQY